MDDVFSGDDNFFRVNAPKGNPAVLIALGERFEVVNTDIKKWTVGTPIQAPLDAIDNIRRKRAFEADEVKSVAVRLAPTVGAVVDNRDIPDICLQHMVAIMLIDKTASFHAAHDKARMQDAVVLRQRSKVTYVPDPTWPRCCRRASRSWRSRSLTERSSPIASRPSEEPCATRCQESRSSRKRAT